jgi:hypothetical protein
LHGFFRPRPVRCGVPTSSAGGWEPAPPTRARRGACGLSPTVGRQVTGLRSETMKKQLICISILQSSKIMTALYVLMGFIYTLIGIPMAIFGDGQIQIMGIVYILMPIILGIFGFIFFVIFTALYNLLAQRLCGFEFELKDID